MNDDASDPIRGWIRTTFSLVYSSCRMLWILSKTQSSESQLIDLVCIVNVPFSFSHSPSLSFIHPSTTLTIFPDTLTSLQIFT